MPSSPETTLTSPGSTSSACYSVVIDAGPWPCPLTALEQALQAKAGMTPYRQGFLVHYLEALVYPDVPEAVVTWGAVAVCAVNVIIYVVRFRRRALSRKGEQHPPSAG